MILEFNIFIFADFFNCRQMSLSDTPFIEKNTTRLKLDYKARLKLD